MNSEDKIRLQASLNRLQDLFKEIAVVADQVCTWRCPYKDRNSHCTAQFGCRNQKRTGRPGELPLCAGDDRLNYKSAWET